MRSLHLFAGAGGGLLCDRILGHTPIAAVEWDPYCCAVLRERAAGGWFPGLRVHEGDVRLWDPSEYAGRVDIIHAGFPCQDISTAGRGEGITGARSGLYVEVMRAIDAIRPRWVFLENSPAIRTRGRHVVIADLRARGYSWRDGSLAASHVGANHKRLRWWCLAHSDGEQLREQSGREHGQDGQGPLLPGIHGEAGPIADTDRPGQRADRGPIREPEERNDTWGLRPPLADSDEIGRHGRPGVLREGRRGESTDGGWWDVEPGLGRLAHGVSARVHQIRALGNAQVPLQAAAAYRLLGGP